MHPTKRVVYKFATGQEIPEGARYLTTVVQEIATVSVDGITSSTTRLVWHYYEVEVAA
jgi:hypothetical protein